MLSVSNEVGGRPERIADRLTWPDLHAGLRFDYQPIVALADGATVGLEALARWTDADLGEISPAEFLPVVQRAGGLAALTDRALDDGLRAVNGDRFLSVNVDVDTFSQLCFPGRVLDACTRAGFPPHLLLVEVTESAVVTEPGHVHLVMSTLQRAGVRIALDDLGGGTSTVTRMIEFQFDVVKLDRSLTRLVHSRRGADGMREVVRLVHALGAVAVAEGIEDVATARRCAELGVDLGQGWLFGRPGCAVAHQSPGTG